MTITSNINKINQLYRQWQPLNSIGEPAPQDAKASALLPVDHVTLSARAFRDDGGNGPGTRTFAAEKELIPEKRKKGGRIDLTI